MINVDISNVWTCVTLPELLGSEKEIFDAHNLLCNHQPDGPDLLGWVGLPDSINARLIHGIRLGSCDLGQFLRILCNLADTIHDNT